MQLAHPDHFSTTKKFPLIILTDNIIGEANIGSIFRLADAFNIHKIIFTGSPINLKSNRLKKTARSTYKYVDFEYMKEAAGVARSFIEKGYKTLAIEITSNSVSIDSISYENETKLLLIVGNESAGISSELLELSHKHLHINMFGENSSMNVAQATGIALYEITKTLLPFPNK
ncbi:SpoU rRNA Methylase family protein [Gillisia sp. Hel1_33_143]|uniref:TrmH family RNA methyltransferase n=1 Tax=Gillisia sp. Hel1_33_143 TaxID=1336796 RepID=UPI00087C1FDC|nr:TrmH family RNA methyltransferase [Gillisia sp. Hel1_33_143]SDS56406.1 SpoU rRNA Methylase family protein [Gillisia sp. Hel1_33_143]